MPAPLTDAGTRAGNRVLEPFENPLNACVLRAHVDGPKRLTPSCRTWWDSRRQPLSGSPWPASVARGSLQAARRQVVGRPRHGPQPRRLGRRHRRGGGRPGRSCVPEIGAEPTTWAVETAHGWLDVVIDRKVEELRIGGVNPQLALDLASGIHFSLFLDR